jgi:hypothetical protein
MKTTRIAAVCAVLASGLPALAGDVALRLVDTVGNSFGTHQVGTLTLEVRALVTPTAGEGGLALFGFDFEVPPDVPLASNQFTTMLTKFVKDEGLTNPAGFGGTASGNKLIQVGGSQNTIGYAGLTPSYPTGPVVLGIGLTETTIATIELDTSPLPSSVYTFAISNAFANLIDPASQPSAPPYTLSAATMLPGSPTYSAVITGGPLGPPRLVSPARSWKDHGDVLGKLAIDIPVDVQANNRHIVEPRQGSVTEMTLTFDRWLNWPTFTPENIQVCGLNSVPGHPATATLGIPGTEGTVTFAPGQIPNGELNGSAGDCYVLLLSPGVTGGGGYPIDPTANKLYFAASYGNVKSDGVLNNWKKVNAVDRSQVALNLTTTPTPAQALAYDVRLQGPQAGKINAQDVSTTVLSFSTTDLDNTVLPACP